MFSAELPETITRFEGARDGGVFDNCRSLRNVAVPPRVVVGENTFKDCTDLLQLFDSNEDIVNTLQHRFDNLPIHKMIYYHSYNNLTSEQLERVVVMRSNHSRALLLATFQCLVKVSISTRVDAIGLKLWRDDMSSMMAEPIPQSKSDWLSNVKSKLSHYESEYQRLKEATSMLELALWKTTLDELGKGENTMSNKKRKIDDSDLRSRCRISCGADIVIEHVLPYLTPKLSREPSQVCNGDESD